MFNYLAKLGYIYLIIVQSISKTGHKIKTTGPNSIIMGSNESYFTWNKIKMSNLYNSL